MTYLIEVCGAQCVLTVHKTLFNCSPFGAVCFNNTFNCFMFNIQRVWCVVMRQGSIFSQLKAICYYNICGRPPRERNFEDAKDAVLNSRNWLRALVKNLMYNREFCKIKNSVQHVGIQRYYHVKV